jgi:hypothetical protein
MLKLLKAVVVLGALAGLVFLLPLGGRTVADRWSAADGARDFGRRLWTELRGRVPSGPTPSRPGQKAQARAGERPGGGRAAERPVERTTEADRAEVDRIVGERLRDPAR